MDTDINDTKEILTPLYNAKGWIQFSGIISIVMGVLSSFSIVGLLTSWMMIWPGILLCLASSKLKASYEEERGGGLKETMAQFAFYFKLYGIFMLLAAVGGFLAAILIPAFVKASQM